jgi:hypothetical protein
MNLQKYIISVEINSDYLNIIHDVLESRKQTLHISGPGETGTMNVVVVGLLSNEDMLYLTLMIPGIGIKAWTNQ